MRAQFIYERFTEDSDPIQDMGIGMPFAYVKRKDVIKPKNADIPNFEKSVKRIFGNPEHFGASVGHTMRGAVRSAKIHNDGQLKLVVIFFDSIEGAKNDCIDKGALDKNCWTVVTGKANILTWSKYFEIVEWE